MALSLVNGISSLNGRPIFGARRNKLKSTWQILFGDHPKEWISFKPTLGDYVYPCYACRHMFSSLFSLQDHLNRRILVVKYNCTACPDILTFHNRCALLLHTRMHYRLEEGEINLSEIDTFTLPVELAGFLPTPNIPSIFQGEEELITENVYLNVQFYTPNNNQRGKRIIKLKPDDFVFKEHNPPLGLKQICRNIPKCQFITLEEQKRLKEHAQVIGDLSSHVKVELFDYVDQFTLPVISKVESLHEKTFNIPRCLDCNSVQHGTMAQHYQGGNKPTDKNLTCSCCKFVAATNCSFQAHVRIHDNEAPHVCPDCGKNFDTPETLRKHIDEVCFHLAKCVKYRCPGKKCSKLFASLTNFAIHFKLHMKWVCTCTTCNAKFFAVNDLEDHMIFHSRNCTFIKEYECGVCVNKTVAESDLKKHIDVHADSDTTAMYVYLCRHCRNYFRSTATFAAHLLKCAAKMVQDSRKYCKWRSNYKSNLQVTKRFFCVLCNEQIPMEKKVAHMSLCKYARPVIYVYKLSDSVLINYNSSNDFNSSNDNKRSKLNESPKSDESVKKKRKRYLTDISRRRRPEVEPDLIAEKPVEFDGTYHCKLCDFNSLDRSEFHLHIKIHRDISTAYQCMECGECFVVKPSLNKHLLHFHNIVDYDSYLKENDCFDVEAVKELETMMRLAPGETKSPVKENQCRVCLEQFEDESALKQHSRVHGLAFLLKNSK